MKKGWTVLVSFLGLSNLFFGHKTKSLNYTFKGLYTY